jgi:hypothetical protein
MIDGEEKREVEGGRMVKKGEEKKEVADHQPMCVTVADKRDIGKGFVHRTNVTSVAEEGICPTIAVRAICRMKREYRLQRLLEK